MARTIKSGITAAALAALMAGPGAADDWTHYGGSAASSKYSPLGEIAAANFAELRVVWQWAPPDREIAGMGNGSNRATPVAVDGVVYFSTPLNIVVAIDAASGEELWRYDPGAWQQEDFFHGYHRGVAHWRRPDGGARILFGTFTGYLHSLDAATGQPDPEFGDGGRVDLTQGLGRAVARWAYANISPPIVVDGVAVIGSALIDWWAGRTLPELPPPGDVRGFDAATGELLWTFATIPAAGEYGAETWEAGNQEIYGGANAWAPLSADEQLGYVYLPVATPSSDYYGGGRPGDNLFGDSIVCLDAKTGARVWHYQLIHHGVWDYDTNAAPVLLDVVVDGRPVKAVAQTSKQGFCYVFDRVTGEPLWPIEERAVPPSAAPGEKLSPTQPFPTKPAAFERQGLGADDLIDFTPELRQQALAIVSGYDYGPLYTPPSARGTVFLPGIAGGATWAGAVAHPGKGVLYVPSFTSPSLATLREATAGERPYRYIGRMQPGLDGPQDLPLTKPPYGRITAIDLNSGEHAWQRPLGVGPVDHPALRHLDLPDLGWPVMTFASATPNMLLVVHDEPWMGGNFYIDPNAYLLAYDLDDGRELGRVPLPGFGHGNPITFMADGRQQIVVPMGDARLVALALPRAGEALPRQVFDRSDAEHAAFHDAVDLLDAGDADGLRALLAAEPGLVAARGYLAAGYRHGYFRGATLLHHVAGNPIRARLPDNAVEIARILLGAGADPNARTETNSTPLLLTIGGSQPRWNGIKHELIRALVAGGADPNAEGGLALFTALSGSVSRDERDLGALLYESGAGLDLRFAAGLGLVAEMERFVATDGRLTADASTAYRPGYQGEPSDAEVLADALAFAAYHNRAEAVEWLLARGADINAYTPGFLWPEDAGSTALHKAVSGRQPEMIALLLAAGADPSLPDKNFDSAPGNWAGYFGEYELVAIFEAQQAAKADR